ncbi:hypothetical protein CN918_29605 [Priestia megaterium]|nr:hypothetical protein CN918_29605 [Priestia megaterium]
MDKKITACFLLLLASLIAYFFYAYVGQELNEEVIFSVFWLFPFAWLTTVIYCKYLAPHVKKRVAGLTIFSILMIAVFTFTFIEHQVQVNSYKTITKASIDPAIY